MKRHYTNRHQGRNRNNNGNNSHKARNNAKQQQEKYLNQARDARSNGDLILSEKYYQFADHYFRVYQALMPDPVDIKPIDPSLEKPSEESKSVAQDKAVEIELDDGETQEKPKKTSRKKVSEDKEDEGEEAPKPKRRTRKPKAEKTEPTEAPAGDAE